MFWLWFFVSSNQKKKNLKRNQENIYGDLLRVILTIQLNDSILKPSLAQFCEIDHCSFLLVSACGQWEYCSHSRLSKPFICKRWLEKFHINKTWKPCSQLCYYFPQRPSFEKRKTPIDLMSSTVCTIENYILVSAAFKNKDRSVKKIYVIF